jgi:hypothetical protein
LFDIHGLDVCSTGRETGEIFFIDIENQYLARLPESLFASLRKVNEGKKKPAPTDRAGLIE